MQQIAEKKSRTKTIPLKLVLNPKVSFSTVNTGGIVTIFGKQYRIVRIKAVKPYNSCIEILFDGVEAHQIKEV